MDIFWEDLVQSDASSMFFLFVCSHIRDRLASPLYLLTKAIKHQISCGPVDAITLEAHYSLAEERLLRPQIEPNNVVSNTYWRNIAEERLLRPQIEPNNVVSNTLRGTTTYN